MFAVLDGSSALTGDMLTKTDELAKMKPDVGVDPIVIGYMGDAFTRAQSSNNFLDRLIPDGLQLALSKLNAKASTFPFPNRKVVVLVCGQTDEPGTPPGASAAAVAQHLASVGAKAVIGPTNEPKSREVAAAIAGSPVASQFPIISSWLIGQSAASSIPGLLWLPAPQRGDLFLPVQAVLSDLESEFKKVDANKKISVTLVVDTGDTTGEWDKYESIMGALKFNGKLATSNASEDKRYRVYRTGDAAYADPTLGPNALANAIHADLPDVIIPLAGVTIINKLPALVEKSFKAGETKPHWLVPSNQSEFPSFGSPGTYVTGATAIDQSVRDRVTGVRVYRGSANYEQVTQVDYPAYAKTAPVARPVPQTPYESIARGYEDLFLAYYASYKAALDAAAAGKTDFTPIDMVNAIPLVTDAQATPFGCLGSDLDKALLALKTGNSIKLYGLLSTFEFTNQGVASSQWERWEIDSTASSVTGNYPFVSKGCFVPPPPGTEVGTFTAQKCIEFRGEQTSQ